jgi:uncharacterized SAM-binding protein YcdF (DUF218 family)
MSSSGFFIVVFIIILLFIILGCSIYSLYLQIQMGELVVEIKNILNL